MGLFKYMHVWNSYNKNYFYAAIELIFLLIPSFIPNIYFLKIAIFQKTLKKRPILRYSIIIQATQYICSTTLSLSITLLYLFAVYNGTKIHMLSCSLLRCFQHLLLFSLSSTPLILAITRNYIIVLNKKLNNISILVLGVIFNSPTLCVLYNFFLNHTIVVDHEICGKIIEIENMTIGLMSILCTSAYPFLTVFVNTITYLSLKQQYLRISIDNKFKHEKEVLINLCIQSMIPLISQAPMLSLLLLSYINHWESDYFLWRITDLIYYTHFIYVIFLSTYFIKEIRLSIIPWLKKDNSQISFI